ncbi:hypothetical protein HK099_001767 [Clydaea vesicula]|uniref:Uncharacterized protein n=1 Tax=Clydaea vesicula TaxID=447962 RepID=A0AAD5TTK7_9FUNG|nr:hypothetical protein HK099_001767 [Clydaea vesicula]
MDMKTPQIKMDETEKEIKNIKLLLEKKNDELDKKKKDVNVKKKEIEDYIEEKQTPSKLLFSTGDRWFLRLDDELKCLQIDYDKLLSVIIEKEKQLTLLMEKEFANPNENLPKRVKKDNQEVVPPHDKPAPLLKNRSFEIGDDGTVENLIN